MEQAELIQMNIKAHVDLQGLSTSTGAEQRSIGAGTFTRTRSALSLIYIYIDRL